MNCVQTIATTEKPSLVPIQPEYNVGVHAGRRFLGWAGKDLE